MENYNFKNNNSNIEVLLFNASSSIPQNTIVASKSEGQSSWRKTWLQRCSQVVAKFFEPFYEGIKKVATILDFFIYTCARVWIKKVCSFVAKCRENKNNTIKNLATIWLQYGYNDYNYYLTGGEFS